MIDPSMKERIKRVVFSTWDEIAPDALVDEDGLPSQRASMKRETVWEIVWDAGRAEAVGGDPEAARYFLSLPYKEGYGNKKFMKECLPFKRYGW